MLNVGLTGGIASGKTTISDLFANLGITIIDTDVISHQLMHKGEAAYQLSVAHFGQQIVDKHGDIKRPALRRLVFEQPQQKQWLENMIHPLIRERTLQQVKSANNEHYVLIVVPLMFETGFNDFMDHIIAIDCPAEVQLSRLIKRDQIDYPLAKKIIHAQIDNASRLARADSIIANSENSNRQNDVKILHQNLLKLT